MSRWLSFAEQCRMRHNCIYIMSNRNRTVFYVGVTNNLARRRLEHLHENADHFCGRYSITDVVYVEWFEDIRHAIAREKRLKRRSRKEKLDLIRTVNPSLATLVPPFFLLPEKQ